MIYLDNAATTKTAPEVVEAMLLISANTTEIHPVFMQLQEKAKKPSPKEESRSQTCSAQKPEEIYFTAGGSESDNWALKATFEAYKNKGNHIITTKIEHHAILHTCEYLEKERGAKITYIASMRTALSIWMNSKQPSHRRPF